MGPIGPTFGLNLAFLIPAHHVVYLNVLVDKYRKKQILLIIFWNTFKIKQILFSLYLSCLCVDLIYKTHTIVVRDYDIFIFSLFSDTSLSSFEPGE